MGVRVRVRVGVRVRVRVRLRVGRVGPPLDGRVEVGRVAAIGDDAEDELQRPSRRGVALGARVQQELDVACGAGLEDLEGPVHGDAALRRHEDQLAQEGVEQLRPHVPGWGWGKAEGEGEGEGEG